MISAGVTVVGSFGSVEGTTGSTTVPTKWWTCHLNPRTGRSRHLFSGAQHRLTEQLDALLEQTRSTAAQATAARCHGQAGRRRRSRTVPDEAFIDPAGRHVAPPTPVNYSSQVSKVVRSETFDRWLRKLKDRRAAARVLVRIDRLAAGNPGDVKPVGAGISELRIDYGPGYRVYYLRDGDKLIVLLCGGDKSTQDDDIKNARRIAKEWKETRNDDQHR